MTVRRIADQDGAHEPAVADRQLLVDPQRAILIPDRLRVLFAPVAGGEDIDTHDLELGGLNSARIHRALVTRDGRGQNLRLLEQRRDEAVADPAMLDAFADG